MRISFSDPEAGKGILQEELGASAEVSEALLQDGYLDLDEFIETYQKYGFRRLPVYHAGTFTDGGNHFSYPATRLSKYHLRGFFQHTFKLAAEQTGASDQIETNEVSVLKAALELWKKEAMDALNIPLHQAAEKWVEANFKLEMGTITAAGAYNEGTHTWDRYAQTTYKVENFPISVTRLMENTFSDDNAVNQANNALIKDSFGEITYTGKADSQGQKIFRVRRVLGWPFDDKEIYMTVEKVLARDESGLMQGKIIARLTPKTEYQQAGLPDPVNPYSFLELEYNIIGNPDQNNSTLKVTLKVNPGLSVLGYDLYHHDIVGSKSQSDFGKLLKNLAVFGVFNAMGYYANLEPR